MFFLADFNALHWAVNCFYLFCFTLQYYIYYFNCASVIFIFNILYFVFILFSTSYNFSKLLFLTF